MDTQSLKQTPDTAELQTQQAQNQTPKTADLQTQAQQLPEETKQQPPEQSQQKSQQPEQTQPLKAQPHREQPDPATAKATVRKRRKKKKYFSRGTMFLLCLVFSVAFLLPTVLTITNSFMSESEIASNYGMIFSTTSGGYVSETVNLKFIPDKVTFSQYLSGLIKTPEYLLKLWNSIFLTVPIVIFQLLVASITAYGFTRWRGKVRSGIFFFYVILMLMPYQVTLVPNYLVAKTLGLINTRWSIILPGIFAPFSVFLLTKFMRRIPVGCIEAAKMDGAGEWQIFTKICLPQCKTALYSIAILVFVDYWNMVEQPLILLEDEEAQPLSVFLSNVSSGEIGLAFAMATVYMIPSLLLFLHGEEYLVEGIAANGGSVKG